MTATAHSTHPTTPGTVRASLYRKAAATAGTEAWDTTDLVASLRAAADRADAEPRPARPAPQRHASAPLPAAYDTWPI